MSRISGGTPATPDGQVSDIIRVEAPREVYDAMYEEEGAYDLPYKNSHYYPMFAAAFHEVQRLARVGVLEVGCGSGSFAQLLRDRSDIPYRGFDFSPKAVRKARERVGGNALFTVADARDPDVYGGDFDTIVCTEVLEHIEQDLKVVETWPQGVACVCSVPNFDYATHVRYFETIQQVRDRYEPLIRFDRIQKVPRPPLRGRTMREYLQQLRWNRNDPKRFMALLGYKTFENLAGWFVFSGWRR